MCICGNLCLHAHWHFCFGGKKIPPPNYIMSCTSLNSQEILPIFHLYRPFQLSVFIVHPLSVSIVTTLHFDKQSLIFHSYYGSTEEEGCCSYHAGGRAPPPAVPMEAGADGPPAPRRKRRPRALTQLSACKKKASSEAQTLDTPPRPLVNPRNIDDDGGYGNSVAPPLTQLEHDERRMSVATAIFPPHWYCGWTEKYSRY